MCWTVLLLRDKLLFLILRPSFFLRTYTLNTEVQRDIRTALSRLLTGSEAAEPFGQLPAGRFICSLIITTNIPSLLLFLHFCVCVCSLNSVPDVLNT